jgi:hypothetical protein
LRRGEAAASQDLEGRGLTGQTQAEATLSTNAEVGALFMDRRTY